MGPKWFNYISKQLIYRVDNKIIRPMIKYRLKQITVIVCLFILPYILDGISIINYSITRFYYSGNAKEIIPQNIMLKYV